MSLIKVLVTAGVWVASVWTVSAQEVMAQYSVDGAQTWNDLPFGDYMQNSDGSIRLFGLPTVSNALYRLDIKKVVPPEDENMVEVFGGVLPLSSDFALDPVDTFLISRYEVTWAEWIAVSGWGLSHGYTNLFPGANSGRLDQPVSKSFQSALVFCNAKSELHGLQPVYEEFDGDVFRIIETGLAEGAVVLVFQNTTNNGFRLPSEREWEFAARGGNLSAGYPYSGSTNIKDVAWYEENTEGTRYSNFGHAPLPVGLKNGNELDLYDMSGNRAEWCWDIGADSTRAVRGGGYLNSPSACEVGARSYAFPFNNPGNYTLANGFRVARNAVP